MPLHNPIGREIFMLSLALQLADHPGESKFPWWIVIVAVVVVIAVGLFLFMKRSR